MVDVNSPKIANGDIRRKKLPSDDLTSMHDIIHEGKIHDSAVSSRSPSEPEEEIRKHIIINEHDDIPIRRGSGKYMERHHSVDSDHDDQAKLMKILQDPRRRLSETAAMDRDMHVYPLAGFEDVLVGKVSNTDKIESVSSSDLQTSLKLIPAMKPDPSYSSFEFIDTDKRNSNIAHDDNNIVDPVDEHDVTEHQNNDKFESAIIECESVTINPTGKLHTAESNNKDNHSLTLTDCAAGIPKVIIVDEVKNNGHDFEVSKSEEKLQSETNDTWV